MPRSMAIDMGRSGKTAFAIVSGEDWKLRLTHMVDYSSISAPEVETAALHIYNQFLPQIIIVEMNGPGGVFTEFMIQKSPFLANILYLIDPSQPPIELELWPGFQFLCQLRLR